MASKIANMLVTLVNLPLINSAILLLVLSDGQLCDGGLHDIQLCGRALVLARLDVEVGLDSVI
jgi:hypothetical protein